MKILVLGATGLIGSAVAQELALNNHTIFALARSSQSEEIFSDMGYEVVSGDLCNPEAWIDVVGEVDCVVHAAATFSPDMGDVDKDLVEALIVAARSRSSRLRLIYTGGCWLYGETGDHVAVESDSYNPIPAFSWMVTNSELALKSPYLDTILIHPAMVYERDGGVLLRFVDGATEHEQIEVWGSLETRWPVVQRHDLARAYRLVMECGVSGQSYNVNSEEGVRVGDIVGVIAKRFGVDKLPLILNRDEVVCRFGDWALGPMLDQQMGCNKIKEELGWVPKSLDIFQEIC